MNDPSYAILVVTFCYYALWAACGSMTCAALAEHPEAGMPNLFLVFKV